MANMKVIFLVIFLQCAMSLSYTRGPTYDPTLFLFLSNNSENISLSTEYLCGGILVTRYHILTSDECVKKLKKKVQHQMTLQYIIDAFSLIIRS